MATKVEEGDVHYFPRFLVGERVAEEFVLAIAEPLFDHLIAADGVVPHASGDDCPAGECAKKL